MGSKPDLIPGLKEFFTTPSRYKVLYGGRASGKSYSTALHSVILASNLKLKFLCIRQYQSNIRESVYTLIKDIIYELGLQDEFDILMHTIRHKRTGSEFIFYGIARNFMEIKSTEGVDICWIEEAHALSKEQWEVINPTIRNEHSEIWLIFNPQNRGDFVWQRFSEHPHEDSIVKKLNYIDNPYLSKTMLSVIEEAKKEDFEEYEHIYLGKPREGDDKALFRYDEIEDAMTYDENTQIDKSGVFSYAADIARFGGDSSCLTKRRGFFIYWLQTYKGYDTSEMASIVAHEYSKEQDKKPNGIFVDTIGVGSGVIDKLNERGYRTIEANVGMKPDEIDIYVNKRAEMYFNLREWIRRGGKLPKDDDLKEELLATTYIYSKINSKIQISPKDEIKELLGRSPDKADSVALHFFSTIRTEGNDIAALQKKMFKRRARI